MRSVTGFCALVGATAGSFAPLVWGGSEMSLTSVLFGVVGGIAGVWVGHRVASTM